MKYSLESTSPWIEKYFDEYIAKDSSNFRNIKSFFNFWISSYDEELKHLIADKGSFASGWG